MSMLPFDTHRRLGLALDSGEFIPAENIPAPSVDSVTPERAWLVEWRWNGTQWLYLTGRRFSFTADPSRALRFARRADAEVALAWVNAHDGTGAPRRLGEMLATEHQWGLTPQDGATPQAQPPQPALPAELDVRRILLDIVPGDGSGLEVYAKTVADVERKLSEMGERIADLEDHATPQAQPATPPAVQAPWILRQTPLTDLQVTAVLRASGLHEPTETLVEREIARAIERAHGIGAAAQGGEHD